MDKLQELKEKLENLFITRGIHLEFNKNDGKYHPEKVTVRVKKEKKRKRKLFFKFDCLLFLRQKIKRAKEKFPKHQKFTHTQHLKRGFNITKYVILPEKETDLEKTTESNREIFIDADWRYNVVIHESKDQKAKKKCSLLRKIFSMMNSTCDYNFELQTWQFYFFLLLNETNVAWYLPIFQIFRSSGLLWTALYLFITTIVCDMPLMVALMTMCSYSKSFYIKYFDAIPVLTGLSIAFALIQILATTMSITYIVAALFLLMKVLGGSQWQDCKLLPKNCISPLSHRNEKFCDKAEFLTQSFLKSTLGYHRVSLNVDVHIIIFLIWLITYIVSLFGFRRFKNILSRIGLITTTIGFIIIIIFCLEHISEVKHIMPLRAIHFDDNTKDIFYALVISPQTFPTLMWISTMKPADLEPQKVAMGVCFCKCIGILIMISFIAIGTSVIVQTYNFSNFDCLKFEDLDILLTIITDTYIRYPYGFFYVIIWLSSISISTFIIVLITIIVFTDSLIQAFPKLKKESILIYTIYQALIFTTSLMIIHFGLHREFQNWISLVSIITNNFHLGMLTFGIYFLYTPSRFIDDYIFTYGYPPRKGWLTSLGAIPYFASITSILSFSRAYYWITQYKSHTGIFYCCFSFFLVGVTSAIMLYKIIYFSVNNNISNITAVRPGWGPYNPKVKHLRRLYFSQRDVRRRREMPACVHKCLLRSNVYHYAKENQLLALENISISNIFERYSTIEMDLKEMNSRSTLFE